MLLDGNLASPPTPLGREPTKRLLRGNLALGLVETAILLLRATAIALLASPLVLMAMLIF